jgi:hypothetical protein
MPKALCENHILYKLYHNISWFPHIVALQLIYVLGKKLYL